MGYYSGNGFAIRSPYIQHYGRKGMKWGQNIFEDFVSGVSSGFRGARSETEVRRNQYNAKVSTLSKIPDSNARSALASRYKKEYRSSGGDFGSYNRKYGDAFRNNNASALDRAMTRAGNFVGVTAYNATVVAKKISDAAKQTWSSIKSTGSALINRGRDLFKSLFGGDSKQRSNKTEPVKKSLDREARQETVFKATGRGEKNVAQQKSTNEFWKDYDKSERMSAWEESAKATRREQDIDNRQNAKDNAAYAAKKGYADISPTWYGGQKTVGNYDKYVKKNQAKLKEKKKQREKTLAIIKDRR